MCNNKIIKRECIKLTAGMIKIISYIFYNKIPSIYFFIFHIKGTKLRVFPREIAAYDQDLGINANIFYTLNSG